MAGLGNWSWEGLNAFFAAAQAGTLSAGASALGTSQPTVGRRIDALERDLGARVLERRPSGCRPTALGERLLPHLEQIRRHAVAMEAVLAEERSDLRGVVRIATGPMLGQHLARHADVLLAGMPALQLEVVPAMAYEELERGKADIAVRNRRPDAPDALARRIGDSPFGVYASSSYIQGRQLDLTAVPGGGQRWVGYVHGSSAPSARWLHGHLGRDADVRFGTSIAILEAAASGVGLAVLPAYAGDGHPHLHRVGPLLWDALCFQVWLVRPGATADVPRVRTVADRLAHLLPSQARPTARPTPGGRDEN